MSQALTTKEKIAHMKAAMPGNVAKALGRLSSGLYIVTAQQENARRYGQGHTVCNQFGCSSWDTGTLGLWMHPVGMSPE